MSFQLEGTAWAKVLGCKPAWHWKNTMETGVAGVKRTQGKWRERRWGRSWGWGESLKCDDGDGSDWPPTPDHLFLLNWGERSCWGGARGAQQGQGSNTDQKAGTVPGLCPGWGRGGGPESGRIWRAKSGLRGQDEDRDSATCRVRDWVQVGCQAGHSQTQTTQTLGICAGHKGEQGWGRHGRLRRDGSRKRGPWDSARI